MLRKTSFLIVAALLAAAPTLAGHNERSGSDFADVYAELAVLEDLAHHIDDHRVHDQVEHRLERIEHALLLAEKEVKADKRRLRERLRAAQASSGHHGSSKPDDRHGNSRPGYSQGYDRPSRSYLTYSESKSLIDNAYWESSKLESMDSIARNARLTTAEAKALANLMYFESGKRDALIKLYPAVSDPHRFALALDILSFSSSRREVSQALSLY